MPLRGDIDGDLVWVTKVGDPALVLEEDYVDITKFWVKLMSVDGDLVTQTRYDTLREALTKFAELLPKGA